MQGLPKSRETCVVQNTPHLKEKGFGSPEHQGRKQYTLEEEPFQRLAGSCHGPGKKLLEEVYTLLPWICKLARQHLVSEELCTKLTLVFYCFPTHSYVLEGQT